MTAIALIYIGGVLGILPAVCATDRWGMFLVQALLWPVAHVLSFAVWVVEIATGSQR